MDNPNGWLEYGSADDSIILQHPLTSDPSSYFGSISTLTVQGTGHVHDSVRGFCPSGTGGYKLVDLVGYLDLDHCGQITYEVERAFVCMTSASFYSSGYTPSADEYCITATPTSGGAYEFGRKLSSNMSFYGCSIRGYIGGLYIHSPGKSDYVRVNVGWTGGKVGGKIWVAIDGMVLATGTANAATLSGMLKNLYIGGDRGIAGRYMAQHYIRNLQISNRPPMFAVHPLLRHVGIISDSLMYSDDNTNSNYKDNLSSWVFRRELAKKGLHYGTVTVTVDSGARLDDSTDGGTTDYIRTQLTTLLALNPTIVIIRGCTNDAINSRCSQSTWQAAVTDYIDDCMAVSSVRRVIFLGIPSAYGGTATNSATFKSERATGEAKIQSAIDAWRAANPSDTRNIILADDIYTRLGGESPADGTFIGQVDGTMNEIHFSSYGHYLHGKAIADWVIKELGTA